MTHVFAASPTTAPEAQHDFESKREPLVNGGDRHPESAKAQTDSIHRSRGSAECRLHRRCAPPPRGVARIALPMRLGRPRWFARRSARTSGFAEVGLHGHEPAAGGCRAPCPRRRPARHGRVRADSTSDQVLPKDANPLHLAELHATLMAGGCEPEEARCTGICGTHGEDTWLVRDAETPRRW